MPNKSQPYIHCGCDCPLSESSHVGQSELLQHDPQIPSGLPPVNDGPTGILWMTKECQSNLPSLHNSRQKKTAQNLFNSFGFVERTYLHRELHPAFVRLVIPLDRHGPDSDGVVWLVAGFVGLNKRGDVSEAEAQAGGVGEDETVPTVAAHRQVQDGVLA